MQRILSALWKKVCSYSFLMGLLCALAVFLSVRILSNTTSYAKNKRSHILMLSKAAEHASYHGVLPPKTALDSLEYAYHLGKEAAYPYASFLSACFYLHNDPLRGAYYASLAYKHGLGKHLPSPIQALLKETTEAQATKHYELALSKSLDLLSMITTTPDYPTLQFLTLLRIIELKELLHQDPKQDFETLKNLPLFAQLEQFYRDGEWTLTQRFGICSQQALKTS